MGKEAGNIKLHSLTPPENVAIIDRFFDVEAKERKFVRQVIWLQIVTTMICASFVYAMKDITYAEGMLSGGVISTINSVLLAWRMSRSALHITQNLDDPSAAQQQLRLLYLAAGERFFVVIALFCFCILAMRLAPLALLSGFVMGQATLIAARLILNRN